MQFPNLVHSKNFESSFLIVREQIFFSLSGIFIAGGVNGSLYDGTASPPGFYNPLTNVYCDIHGYEYGYQPRYSSTTTGFIVCGGNDVIDYEPEIEASYNCQKFDHSTGTWNLWKSWENEFPGRRLHVAWKSSIGLFLIGGSGKSG